MSVFAVDGDLSRRVMALAQVIGASALTLVVTAPAWLWVVTGGWQATHAALWVGALTTLPLGPAAVALLTIVRGVIVRRGPGRRFFHDYGAALVLGLAAWRSWVGGAGLVLLIGYEVSTAGESTAALAPAVLLAVIGVLAGCAVASGLALRGAAGSGLARASLRAALRHPAVLVVWAFVTVLAVAVSLVPVVGPTLAFLAPAGWAVAVVVINASFGFDHGVLAQVPGRMR